MYSLGRGLLEDDVQELFDEKEFDANEIMEFVGRKNSGAGFVPAMILNCLCGGKVRSL